MNEIFKETKKELIKVFDYERESDKDNLIYLISTFVKIIDRWKKIRIYIFNINEVNKNDKKNI